MRKIENIELQFRGFEPLIVATDAVSIDEGSVRIRRSRGWFAFLRRRAHLGARDQRN
jgi:hypothetical protein